MNLYIILAIVAGVGVCSARPPSDCAVDLHSLCASRPGGRVCNPCDSASFVTCSLQNTVASLGYCLDGGLPTSQLLGISPDAQGSR